MRTLALGSLRLLAASALIALAGCNGSSGTPASGQMSAMPGMAAQSPATTQSAAPASGPAVQMASVAIQGFQYQPANVVVHQGGSVIFTNQDQVQHSVTPDQGSQFSGIASLQPGQSQTITFNTVGTQHYHCAFHPSMVGTVTVQ